jgi:hypothetical protein
MVVVIMVICGIIIVVPIFMQFLIVILFLLESACLNKTIK